MHKSRLLLLFLTLFFVMLGFGIIIPNLAYYAEEIGATPTQIAILLSVYSGMQLVFAPIWGKLSDIYGRKPAILLGLLGNAVALAAFGLAKEYMWLFVARSAAGIASAAVLPTVMAYVADVTTSEERGKGMGLMGAAMGLGFILGPAIGGIMGRHDLPFFVAGGLSLITFFLVLVVLPESLQRELESETHVWLSPQEAVRRTVSNISLIPLFLVAFFTTFSFSGLEATFPLYIKEGWGFGQKEMGWMFMIMGAIVVPIQGGLLGRLINIFGERRIILIGLFLNVLGMVLFLNATSFMTLTIFLTITAIGNQLIRPTNTSWISKQAQIGQGTAIGIMDTFLSLGRILGPLLGGWLYDKSVHPEFIKTIFSYNPMEWLYGRDAYSYVILAGILLIAIVCLYIPLRWVETQVNNDTLQE
ncbi:tetracycline resistance MFS efflux pump [Candidatus Poribacteria bacterium]|nr:MAG: tetracycline resistance MFS efflux pump [Candidatus Poribacteria bacterium]